LHRAKESGSAHVGALGYANVFDRELYSCDLGSTKPSSSYFDEVIRITGLDPGRTLFIDDRLDNVEAARGCGFAAEQFVLWEVEDGAGSLARLLRKHGVQVEPPASMDG
jgi:putative hydrolase of the HAD superfamily